MKKKSISIILCIFVFLLTACQATPSKNAIQQKGNLQEKLSESDESNVYADINSHVYSQKEFSEHNKYEIDADIIVNYSGKIPIYSVSSKNHEEGNILKERIEKAFSGYSIYKYAFWTKESLMEDIQTYQVWLERVKNGLHFETGEPVDDEWGQYGMPLATKFYRVITPDDDPNEEYTVDPVENMTALIEEATAAYKDAPSENDLIEPDYLLPDDGESSYQNSFQAKKGDETLVISVINWIGYVGTDILIWNPELETSPDRAEFSDKFVNMAELSENNDFLETKEYLDTFVKNIGADYMSLDKVKAADGKNAYRFYYTRDINGLRESYFGEYYAESFRDSEEYIELWDPEYFMIETLDGKIVTAEWENSSQIEKTLDNAEVLPWENILEIAEKQLEYLVAPRTKSGEVSLFVSHNDIVIGRIELGYTKMLVADTYDEYQLIPTWNFYGYDRAYPETEICFLTLNAVDGTVMDHNAGY